MVRYYVCGGAGARFLCFLGAGHCCDYGVAIDEEGDE